MNQAQALSKDFDFEKAVPNWHLSADGKQISRQFLFKDFRCAFDFMILSAQYAQDINHHPDWSNSGNRVNVCLSTHSMGSLSELDISMAQAMERFAQQLN